ncbi:MAG: UDP-N-acetyl-D-glucosamine dehydrogenase [Candidatus Poribacteria bacterium]|nr:MAG: UDP-N-acetyl-D-glucosamine dehydrogenase [Candidatus Poribacteria bacterium]
MLSPLAATLEQRIQERQARVAVVGLGYVGLPLLLHVIRAGFPSLGLDIDRQRLQRLQAGDSYVQDVPPDELYSLLSAGKLEVTDDYAQLTDRDIVLVCVPTPLGKSRDPDLRYIVQAATRLAECLHRGQLIILESTTYPGSTEEVVKPVLESGGLRAGDDFFLAFSPERIDPGNRKYTIENTPKIVGGLTPTCTHLACRFYEAFVSAVHPVPSIRTAEMAKLLENAFRALNIALVNELALLSHSIGVDIWEVIEAAATKPFGFMPFYPGPGVGGHCIPVDPHYLSWRVKNLSLPARLIDLAMEINSQMPAHVLHRTFDALNSVGKSVRGAQILIIGVAYKPNVGDTRESPALKVMQLLQERGGRLRYHDPLVPEVEVDGIRYTNQPLSPALIEGSDCVLITTHHDQIDYEMIGQHADLIVDTRNAMRSVRCRGRVFRL